MQKAIIAVFDEYEEARSAQLALLDSGVPQERIDINSAYSFRQLQGADTASLDRSYDPETDKPHGVMDRVKAFFDSLFHDDQDEERRRHGEFYMEALRRGSYVVTVRCEDDGRIDVIEELLDRHGAIDIEERRSNWLSRGWQGYDSNAPAFSDSELAQERAYYRNPMASPASIGSGASLGGSVTAEDRLPEDDYGADDPERIDVLADDQIAAQNHGVPPMARDTAVHTRRARVFTGWR